jgi:hypothetical protein
MCDCRTENQRMAAPDLVQMLRRKPAKICWSASRKWRSLRAGSPFPGNGILPAETKAPEKRLRFECPLQRRRAHKQAR